MAIRSIFHNNLSSTPDIPIILKANKMTTIVAHLLLYLRSIVQSLVKTHKRDSRFIILCLNNEKLKTAQLLTFVDLRLIKKCA